MIPTTRKEINDHWVEICLELKHPVSVAIRAIRFKYDAQIPLNLPFEERKRRFAEILTPQDDSKMDDLLILGQVAAWSFGDVTQKVLDEEVTEPKRKAILDTMNELYFPLAVPASGNLESNITPLS